MFRAFLVFALAGSAFAQVNSSNSSCPALNATDRKIMVLFPSVTAAGWISIPVCLKLGNSFAVVPNPTTPGAFILEANPVIAQTLPQPPLRMLQQRTAIPNNTPATTLTMTITLDKTPAPNSLVLAYTKSSVIGESRFDSSAPDTVKPKEVEVTLPVYRPFSGDEVTVIYWTLEQ
jgi:hypothetical protein